MNIDNLRDEYRYYLSNRNIKNEPVNLYQPVNYIMNLGGKHIRATFLLLAHALFQDVQSDEVMSSAYAIELFHNFSLVHDDIMDDADTRRGKPSLHSKFGINSGILSGDVMLILVYEEFMKISNSDQKGNVMALFTQTAKEVCEGQQYDIDFESREDVSIDDYLLMIKLKTAVLLACALKVGAILGGASKLDADKIYEFGLNIGISFQIQDDLLDTYGEQASVGKMIGGDIQQRKKTILYLVALQNMSAQEQVTFKALYNSDIDIKDKLPKVKETMNEYNVREEVATLKDDYLQKALISLNGVNTNNTKGLGELEEIARYIIKRTN